MKELNKKKIIKLIIVIIIFLILIVIGTLYENNDHVRNFFDKYIFFKEKTENNLPKISIGSTEGLNSYAYKGTLLTLRNNLLTAYNYNGNEEYTLDIQISNPIFESKGDYLCIAEKNGTKIYVISNRMIVWQKDLEGNISDVTINSNGYVAVAISGTSYKTIIQTFDNNGIELFTKFLSTTYVMDMSISPDNKYLAVAEANVSGILIQSNIKIISIEKIKNGEEESIEQTYLNTDGDLIVSLKYQNKDELIVVYDNHIELIKAEINSKISDFTQESVLFVETNNKIIKVIDRNSQIYLQIINADTNDYKEYEIDEPKEIYVSDNTIAINLGSEILFYNNSGWLIKKYSANQEINKIVLSDDLAGIVYNDKIELISL
ncbi:MAG: DUF5711 family protein [Clostridia bacterium]